MWDNGLTFAYAQLNQNHLFTKHQKKDWEIHTKASSFTMYNSIKIICGVLKTASEVQPIYRSAIYLTSWQLWECETKVSPFSMRDSIKIIWKLFLSKVELISKSLIKELLQSLIKQPPLNETWKVWTRNKMCDFSSA